MHVVRKPIAPQLTHHATRCQELERNLELLETAYAQLQVVQRPDQQSTPPAGGGALAPALQFEELSATAQELTQQAWNPPSVLVARTVTPF